MKLNQDCIRDLLIYLEDNISYSNDNIDLQSIVLKNYSLETLTYTAQKLNEEHFLNCTIIEPDGGMPIIRINAITYQGHQFLDTIRDDDIWSKTKDKAKVVASVSLPVLQQLATSFCKSKLGLP